MPAPMRAVVILEDDPDIAHLFSQLLRSYGAEPVVCETSDQVMETVQNRSVALALLDIMLPGTDGRNVAAELRDMNVAFPIYYMTGINVNNITDASRSMVDGILRKPFSIKDLRAILDHCFSDEPIDKGNAGTRDILELATSIATEQESIRRQQAHLRSILGGISSAESEDIQTLTEQFQEFGMGLEACLGRIADRLQQVQSLLKTKE